MAKTVKYEMYVNTAEMFGNLIPISKKVEESNKYDLEKYRKENPDKDTRYVDYAIGMNVETTEHEKYIETLYAFHDNGTALCLRKMECKDGYHWK